MFIWLKEAFELTECRNEDQAKGMLPEPLNKLADAYDNWNNPNKVC